jgi:hypothetical protein
MIYAVHLKRTGLPLKMLRHRGLLRVVCALAVCLRAAATTGRPLGFLFKKKLGQTELISFYKPGEELCEDMEQLEKRVEKKTGKHIMRFNVKNPTNYDLLVRLDNDHSCSGLPYYYNRATHRVICGATTLPNLQKWARGDVCQKHLPPPLSKEFRAAESAKVNWAEVKATKERDTGFKARLYKLAGRA